MSEYHRSEAEKFVTAFLDHVEEFDILDEYDENVNEMVRSEEIEELVKWAQQIYPRKPNGESAREMEVMFEPEREAAIAAAPNVVHLRADFAKRIAANGGLRRIVRDIVEGTEQNDMERLNRALDDAHTFIEAEDGVEHEEG